MKRRVAVYSGTRNVYPNMLTAMKSLISHTVMDKIYFLIEDDDFGMELPPFVETINVSNQHWFSTKSPNYNSHWSYMVLLKVALPEILANEEQVLFLDIDTIVEQDVSPLFEMDMDGYYIAGVVEPNKCEQGLDYVNVGVLMMNLKMFRETGRYQTMISELNTYRYHFPEQDVMNKYLQGHIKTLPSDYNVSVCTEPTRNIIIRHYAAIRDYPEFTDYRKYEKKSIKSILNKNVLFFSERNLDRAENIKAVYYAYDGGAKRFVTHRELREIDYLKHSSYGIAVDDDFGRYQEKPTLHIGHGIPGGKTYGLDQPNAYLTQAECNRIKYAIASSEHLVEHVARQCGIPKERVLPLGMPRTDSYRNKRKGDGKTELRHKRAYLYCPTFRSFNRGVKPDIDLGLLDSLLNDDEVFAIKMHMVTGKFDMGNYKHIIQLDPDVPSAPYLFDCDVLITDYSSIVFDGHLLYKPIVLFEKDSEKYLQERGMTLEYPKDYAKNHCRDEKTLVKMLREAKRNSHDDFIRDTYTSACYDGMSTMRVVNLIEKMP